MLAKRERVYYVTEFDEIRVTLNEIENGWLLSVFNGKIGTIDLPEIYCKTIDEALKLIPDRIAAVSEVKE